MTLNAFVIMPFAEEFDGIYQDIIKPPFEQAGYNIRRADDLSTHQNILHEIVSSIRDADIVVADLTGLNANVFYELGIAHSLRIPTVMIIQEGNEFPFDLKAYEIHKYTTNYVDVRELSEKLTRIAEIRKAGNYKFANPVTDFIDRGEENQIYVPPISGEIDRELDVLEEDLGKLDYLSIAHEAINTIFSQTSELSEGTSWLNNRLTALTVQLNAINPHNPNSIQQRRKIANEGAKELDVFAKRLEASVPKMNVAWEEMAIGLENYINMETIQTEEDRDAVRNLIEILNNFKSQMTTTSSQASNFLDSFDSIRGITQKITKASDRVQKIFSEMIEGFDAGIASLGRIINLFEEMLESDED